VADRIRESFGERLHMDPIDGGDFFSVSEDRPDVETILPEPKTFRLQAFRNENLLGPLTINTEDWTIDTEDDELKLRLSSLYTPYTTLRSKANKTEQRELTQATFPAVPTPEKLQTILDDLGAFGYVFT